MRRVIEAVRGGDRTHANIAAEAVVHSAPDGYTLMAFSITNTINPALFSRLNFNFARDMAGVAGLNSAPVILEVNPTVPVASVPELIAAGDFIKEHIPGAHIAVLEAAHISNLEQPKLYADTVLKFLLN